MEKVLFFAIVFMVTGILITTSEDESCDEIGLIIIGISAIVASIALIMLML